MKKLWIIGACLLCLLLISGCDIPNKTICISHNDIVIDRLDQREWKIVSGTIKIDIGECPLEVNTTS